MPARRKKPRSIPVQGKQFPWSFWTLLVIVVLGLMAYATSFGGVWVFDDEWLVPSNLPLRRATGFQLLANPWAITPPQSALSGRPTVALTVGWNYYWGGDDIWGYHLVNLILHAINAVLLWALIRRTLSGPGLRESFAAAAAPLALVTAAWWLVHPLQTEAVTYVTQRTELIVGLFYLATLYAAARAWDAPRPLRWMALAVICCAVGMASKEVMVTAPVMVVFYDRAFRGSTWQQLRPRRGFYVALAATWLVLAANMIMSPRGDSVGFRLGMTPWQYAVQQCGAIGVYLRLALIPWGLCLDYGMGPAMRPWEIVTGAACILALGSLTLWAWWRAPRWAFLGTWLFVILSPSSSFVPIVTEVAAERRMYLPLAAPLVAIVCGAYLCVLRREEQAKNEQLSAPTLWSGQVPRAVALAAGFVVVLACSALTALRNSDYWSPVSIWSDCVAKRPENTRAWQTLGKYQLNAQNPGAAEATLNECLRINPRSVDAWLNLGGVWMTRADSLATLPALDARDLRVKYNEAIRCYDRALEIEPEFALALNSRGLALQRRGERCAVAPGDRERDLAAAERSYREAIRISPDDPSLRINYGVFLGRQRRHGEATEQYRAAIEADPRSVNGHFNLGESLTLQAAAHVETGNQPAAEREFREAEAEFQRVLQLAPDDAASFENLAKIFAVRHDFETAAWYAARAVELAPSDHPYHARAVDTHNRIWQLRQPPTEPPRRD